MYSGEQESRIEKLYLAWNASMKSNVWRSLMSDVWKSQKTTGLCRYLSVGRVLESGIALYMYALRIWCSVSGHDSFKVMSDLHVSLLLMKELSE